MTDHAEEKAIAIAKKAALGLYDQKDVVKYDSKIVEARKNLKAVLEKVYPPGIWVIAELGGHKVKVEIVSHHFAEDGELRSFNVKTGAVRKFHFSAIQEIVK